MWGEPIEIDGELDEAGIENARCLLEASMVEMVREADRRVGHETPFSLIAADSGRTARRAAGD
jgi:hypothetical protein